MTHFRMEIEGQTLIGKDYGCSKPSILKLIFLWLQIKLCEVIII